MSAGVSDVGAGNGRVVGRAAGGDVITCEACAVVGAWDGAGCAPDDLLAFGMLLGRTKENVRIDDFGGSGFADGG